MTDIAILKVIGLEPTLEELRSYKASGLIQNYTMIRTADGWTYKVSITFPLGHYEKKPGDITWHHLSPNETLSF